MSELDDLWTKGNIPNYSRAVKSGKWFESRLAEPKDRDLSCEQVRSLHRGTYDRLGSFRDPIPRTTYQSMMDDLNKGRHYKVKPGKPMINLESLKKPTYDRSLGKSERGADAVLPRFPPEFDQFHLQSTTKTDYTIPYPYCITDKPKTPDLSDCYKMCTSQFTDTDTYKRRGRNTWQDESGVYYNTHFKRQIETHRNLLGLITYKDNDDLDFERVPVGEWKLF